MSEISDDILLEQLRNGDHSVYDVLYRKYFKNLTLEAEFIVGSWDVAKDVVQSVFVQWLERGTLKKLGEKPELKLKAYMKQAVRFYAATYITRERKLFQREQQSQRPEDLKCEINHGISDLDHMIREFINDLKPMQMHMVTEVYVNDLKIKEVALMYGITPKHVSNYIYNGLKNVRSRLRGKMDHKL
ncbi:hypothetical protein HGH93_21515 [Chitinophaga polysaccharea]|uniref:RNA polymerase sigma factor n=1 Tax=Chitinophaga polysaccharea TaxID=1293035 RepID=UPI0014552842|nr:sigma-70 family RNA polymerase sigma factor [Chitinophaga polysaccharea]NLR60703.1 hypothetical protein [Chitinophaga polysaccharea]